MSRSIVPTIVDYFIGVVQLLIIVYVANHFICGIRTRSRFYEEFGFAEILVLWRIVTFRIYLRNVLAFVRFCCNRWAVLFVVFEGACSTLEFGIYRVIAIVVVRDLRFIT
jgi:hypothetical protein